MDKHLLAGLLYASIPFGLGVYLLLIDSGALKDRSGHDDFYQLIREHRIAALVVGIVLVVLAFTEFFRFLDVARTP